MKQSFEIDQTDVKILQTLLSDSRSKLKDMAKECELSPSAIKNRINRMVEIGLIIEPVLLFNMAFFGYTHPLTIGVNVNPDRENNVINFIEQHVHIAGIDKTVGEYDLCIFAFAKNIEQLDHVKHLLRRQKGVKETEFFLWSNFHFFFKNIDFVDNEKV
ncbi:MAG: hypothetical protein CW716_12810 [Candidatus Bathyarchaeum sp.]|nr:MAG: hypothetical protein CW716_12810 [Candidatus Bathyarchaeum sp.]